MSQLFNLKLATENLFTDAKQIGVPIDQLLQIRISVSASIIYQPKRQLWLSYQVQLPSPTLAAQLDWPAWQQTQVSFNDYLWEQTCLECFISSKAIGDNETTSYIEINASPNGQYALYKFNDYRTPSTLPPEALLQSDSKTKAHIIWKDNFSGQQIKSVIGLKPSLRLASLAIDLTAAKFIPYYQYQRSFGLYLEQISSDYSNSELPADIGIALLHPCVILRFDKTNLYFASAHAAPPDFHQQYHWSKLDYQAALSKSTLS
ncbi:hypothetical protein [Psychrobacter sp. P11G5]|uniref:hypothetical protein n=1 Tax=Psychrobacter sp. P11G5 TaxID=1699624 RepID=UPI00078C2494|nr:hypothetical protein [Psychrobacter sp. P11G5]AMN68252.1 hypothetical protein AK825_11555 [Psychrobacter sp. P11G5]